MKKVFLVIVFFLSVSCLWAQSQTNTQPNVVIIYADDIGYGDLSCYQPKNRVKTPNTDKLASQGLRCMRAYTSSATCTPSTLFAHDRRICVAKKWYKCASWRCSCAH
jgi:hypothetical protein